MIVVRFGSDPSQPDVHATLVRYLSGADGPLPPDIAQVVALLGVQAVADGVFGNLLRRAAQADPATVARALAHYPELSSGITDRAAQAPLQ
jgi:hypothetical protein